MIVRPRAGAGAISRLMLDPEEVVSLISYLHVFRTVVPRIIQVIVSRGCSVPFSNDQNAESQGIREAVRVRHAGLDLLGPRRIADHQPVVVTSELQVRHYRRSTGLRASTAVNPAAFLFHAHRYSPAFTVGASLRGSLHPCWHCQAPRKKRPPPRSIAMCWLPHTWQAIWPVLGLINFMTFGVAMLDAFLASVGLDYALEPDTGDLGAVGKTVRDSGRGTESWIRRSARMTVALLVFRRRAIDS